MARPADRSYGYLPLAPLQHGEPTSVGMVELESLPAIQRLSGEGRPPARDQLLLASLHGEPVATVHLSSPPGAETRAEVLEAVWRDGGREISSHAERCRCMPVPTGPDDLGAGLRGSGHACPERQARPPAGRAAVIVCTVGRSEALERALDSLGRTAHDDWEVVVVDNRPSVSGTRSLVESLAGRMPIRYVAEARPGLARARNAGVAAVPDADFVAFTDDDVVVDEGWLGWLLTPFQDPWAQAVTGLVLPLKLDSVSQKRFELYAGFGKGVAPEAYVLAEDRDEDRFRFLYPYWGGMFGSGNSMAFRRHGLIAIGGFDPALGAGTPTGGGEDIAAFTDVILGGGKLVYEPRAVCWHEHRGEESALRAQLHNYGTGLTAVLWRYLWRDPRFAATTARSLRMLPRLVRRRVGEREAGALPHDLWKLESRGRLRGPWLYTVGRLRGGATAPQPDRPASRRG